MHAVGTEKEYIEKAIECGMRILGFSDHTPMPYPDGYISNAKMRMDQLEGYVDTILALKKEYEKDIDIRLGLEVEYYPALFEQLLAFTGQYPIEYYLLGQHYAGNEIQAPFCADPTDDPAVLQLSCEQCMEALRTGCFTYFAHPDVWYFTGDPAVYDAWIRRLCGEAKRLDIPLEINFLGISDHRHYPNEAFWKIAGETGNKVVFGCDAHSPGMIGNPQAYTIASQIAQRNRLEVLETVELIDPFGTENRSPVPAKAGQRTVPCPGQNRRNARYE